MKKTSVITWVVFLLLPVVLYVGAKLSARGYYITSMMILAVWIIPLWVSYKGRKPQMGELTVIAVMCALAVAGRVLIPVPNFKAIFAVILLTGIAFGPEVGFLVGALSAFISNFFYGHGPFTPWQMFAYGAGGMLSGILFYQKVYTRKRWLQALYGFCAVLFWIGPLLDCAGIIPRLPNVIWESAMDTFISGFYVNLSQGICTAVMLFLFGNWALDQLERIKIRYGILEDEYGL